MLSVVRCSYYHRGEYRETVRGKFLVTVQPQGARRYRRCLIVTDNRAVMDYAAKGWSVCENENKSSPSGETLYVER